MTEENEKNCMKKLSCKNNPGLLGYKEYTAVSIAGNYSRPPLAGKTDVLVQKAQNGNLSVLLALYYAFY